MLKPTECAVPFTIDALPRDPGAYLLVIDLREPVRVRVGRLGDCELPAGRYAYVGSARGPGGLHARVARHLNPARRPHWHIDSLTPLAPVVAVWAIPSAQPRECEWVQWLLAQPDSSVPVAGFGSSDCRAGCPAHLVCIAPGLDLAAWRPGNGESG